MANKSLDWKECLRLSSNREDFAKKILHALEKELPSFQADFKHALETHDLEQLQDQSHKLHGACCYTGMPTLRTLLGQLESQAKSHKTCSLSTLSHTVSQVNHEINNVLKALKKLNLSDNP